MPDQQVDTREGARSERYELRERRARILERLQVKDYVAVEDLAAQFDVSVQSIRRDLTTMAESGLILRKRGGATRVPAKGASQSFMDDLHHNADAKQRVARAAVELLRPGMVAFFYSGTTVARTAMSIPEEVKSGLTIVSNSLPIIDEVGSWSDPNLLAVGGLFLQPYMAFVGPQTTAAFRDLRADIAFVGASGLSAEHGLTTPNQLIAEVGGVIVDRAEMTVIVTDHTKIGKGGLTPIAPLESVDILITDEGADPDALDALRGFGIEIRIV